MLTLLDIAKYIPSNTVTIDEYSNQLNISRHQAKIFERIYCLKHIPIALESTLFDFLSKPVKELFIKHPSIENNVKLIIYAHTSSITASFGQSIVREIQQFFNCANACAISTTLNKCVASIKALEIAHHFLLPFQDNSYALILSGEINYSPTIRHIKNTSISGDAAIALLVCLSNHHPKLLAVKTIVDAQYSKGIWMSDCELQNYDNQYVQRVCSIIVNGLKENGLTLDDIDLILPHNINYPSWQLVANRLAIDLNKIYLNNIPKIAHTLGADVFINLFDAISQKIIATGSKTLMFSVGLGASYGYAIWQH